MNELFWKAVGLAAIYFTQRSLHITSRTSNSLWNPLWRQIGRAVHIKNEAIAILCTTEPPPKIMHTVVRTAAPAQNLPKSSSTIRHLINLIMSSRAQKQHDDHKKTAGHQKTAGHEKTAGHKKTAGREKTAGHSKISGRDRFHRRRRVCLYSAGVKLASLNLGRLLYFYFRLLRLSNGQWVRTTGWLSVSCLAEPIFLLVRRAVVQPQRRNILMSGETNHF